MSVQFSELHSVKGRLVWSPSGELLAATEGNQLMIRSGDSLQIISVHSCVDLIDKVEWSKDSTHILCLIRKRGLVMVWSINDVSWSAKIEEGLAGLLNAMWAPSGTHILTVCEFEIRLTIWSLSDGSAQYIKYPKHSSRGIRFSHNGRYLAVSERSSSHTDIVGIYSVAHWQLIERFSLANVPDLEDILWSHDDQFLVCTGNELSYQFAVYTPRGREVFAYSAYDNAMGISSVQWAPNDKYLAVGSYDDRVRVFNSLTWRIVSDFKLQPNLETSDLSQKVICYQEVRLNHSELKDGSEDQQQQQQTRYVLREAKQMELGKGAKTTTDANSKMGVSRVTWSHDSRFVAAISNSLSEVLWIWDMKYLVFHSLLAHKAPIRAIEWNAVNKRLQLAISCNNDRLYLWSRSGAVVIRVVASRFSVRRISWRPSANGNGNAKGKDAEVEMGQKRKKRSKYQNLISKDCICLIDRNHFCCCYDLDF